MSHSGPESIEPLGDRCGARFRRDAARPRHRPAQLRRGHQVRRHGRVRA